MISLCPFRHKFKAEQGFNLVEIALVLVIVGIMLGGIVTPVTDQVERSQRKNAEQTLDDIKNALLGFAASNGRLPCPAVAIESTGLESVISGTPDTCTSYHGFVPIRTLGISGTLDNNNLMVDPWFSRYRYSISDVSSAAYVNDITLNLVPDLRVCEQSGCTSIISDRVVATIFSRGINTNDVSADVSTSPDQIENIDGDEDFVKRDFSDQINVEFDDHIVWISPNTLNYHLVKAGQVD